MNGPEGNDPAGDPAGNDPERADVGTTGRIPGGKLTPGSEARVATTRASRYLAQLCGHFADAARAEWDERRGFTDFGWGRCTLVATRDALLLRAEAPSEPALGRVEYLLADHTERFGAAESLTVVWARADRRAPPSGR